MLPLPRESHKTPVVVVLADSIVALDLNQGQVITDYIDPLLIRLSESTHPQRPALVASVTYGALHCNGPPVSVTEFLPFDAQHKLKSIPTGQTIAGDPLSMLALDGYVDALKLIDTFRSGSGQGSKEQFSYHLLHIAAGQHDGAETSRCDFSLNFWDARWENIPTKIKERDINLSMILLSPCPKFSELFNAVSPTPMEPWFRKCPHHTVLLSGFASSPERGGNLKMPPRIPAKRPAEDPAENDCPRGRTRRAFSEPTPTPALAPVEAQHQTDEKWSGTLIWPGEKSDVRLQVLAVDVARRPDTATLPTSLQVEIFEHGTQTRDVQAYILKKKAPMMRVKCACETAANEFEALVKSLRRRRCFAIARCGAQGKDSSLSVLLLAPLNEDLLCAILPTSDTQDLPKARAESPAEEEQPEVGCLSLSETSPLKRGNTERMQGDPLFPRPAAFSTMTLDFRQQSQYPQQQQHPPPYHSQEQLSQPQAQQCQQHPPPYHSQGQLPEPHTQQCQQPASSDTLSGLLPDGNNAFDGGLIDPLTENIACVGLGRADATVTQDFPQMPPQQSQILQQQQQQQLPPPYYFHGQPSQPQAQQCQQLATPNTPPALFGGLNTNTFDRGFIGPPTEDDARVGLDQSYAYPYAIPVEVNQGSYGGGVDEAMMSGHTSIITDTSEYMIQPYVTYRGCN